MRKLFFRILPFVTLLSFCSPVIKQSFSFDKLCRLPNEVSETSGIEMKNKKEFWTLNDSGGKDEIYLCSISGKLKHTVKIEYARNHDWEDLAQDDQGNLYISDTGNNENDRKNLRIYKITKSELKSKNVKAQEIDFSYEDQESFPPKADRLYFDCEALIWFHQSLYLFTKSRCWPTICNVYKIPDKPGRYIARKIGSFTPKKQAMNKNLINSYWVTAADISPNGQKLALLSNDRVWIFSNFPEDRFFEGKIEEYKLDKITQKESICFSDNATLYITDEQGEDKREGRNLYKMSIGNLPTTDNQKK